MSSTYLGTHGECFDGQRIVVFKEIVGVEDEDVGVSMEESRMLGPEGRRDNVEGENQQMQSFRLVVE
jgi:hypothetical protein